MKKILCFCLFIFISFSASAQYQPLLSSFEYDEAIASIKQECTYIKETVYADLLDFKTAEVVASNAHSLNKVAHMPKATSLTFSFYRPESLIKCQMSQARALDLFFSRKNDTLEMDVAELLSWIKVLHYRVFYESEAVSKKQSEQQLERLNGVLNHEMSKLKPEQKDLVLSTLYLGIGKFAPDNQREVFDKKTEQLLKKINVKDCLNWVKTNYDDESAILFQHYACNIPARESQNVFDAYKREVNMRKIIKLVEKVSAEAARAAK